jgi:hypothetical protein
MADKRTRVWIKQGTVLEPERQPNKIIRTWKCALTGETKVRVSQGTEAPRATSERRFSVPSTAELCPTRGAALP